MPSYDHWKSVIADVGLAIPYSGDCRQALGIELPVAVINLAHRTDRWQAIESRMRAVGLDKLIKVPAVVGANLDLDRIAPLLAQPKASIEAPPRDHFTMTRPAVGCFLSHMGIWHWMIESRIPRVLVFEDDANPAPGFDGALFAHRMSALPHDKGLVFVGRIIMDGLAEEPRGQELARLYFFNGTFAYLITPATARALMPHLLPMNGHIDHETSMALVKLRHELAAWYTEPHFFEPDWSLRSDCYVPLQEETDANNELGAIFKSHRRLLLGEGRPLLPAYGEG